MKDHIDNIENEENQNINSEIEEQELESPTAEKVTEKEPKSGGFFSKKDKKNKSGDDLHVETEKLKAENAELQDKFLRLYSEFDNYRKRTQKEKLDIIQNASESLIVNLLPVIDDMERAINYIDGKDEKFTSIKDGQDLILQKLTNLLKQKGLKAIDTKDAIFDTDYHEAISFIPASKEEDKGKIMEEVEKGYMLNDKVIRFSKVVIFQ